MVGPAPNIRDPKPAKIRPAWRAAERSAARWRQKVYFVCASFQSDVLSLFNLFLAVSVEEVLGDAAPAHFRYPFQSSPLLDCDGPGPSLPHASDPRCSSTVRPPRFPRC